MIAKAPKWQRGERLEENALGLGNIRDFQGEWGKSLPWSMWVLLVLLWAGEWCSWFIEPLPALLVRIYAAEKKLCPEFPQVQGLCHSGLQDWKGSKALVLEILMRALRKFIFYRNLLPCCINILSVRYVCKSSMGEQARLQNLIIQLVWCLAAVLHQKECLIHKL